MGRACTICLHPDAKQIDLALLGSGYRSVAQQFGLSESALWRHRKNHLPDILAHGAALTAPQPDEDDISDVPVRAASPQHQREVAGHQAKLRAEKDKHAIEAVQQLKAINTVCLEVLRESRETKQHDILLRAVDRIARQIDLHIRVYGRIEDEPEAIDLRTLPEWQQMRTRLVQALEAFPEARLAVVQALGEEEP